MATQAGMVLGTAAYMSPEQAKGFPADQRSDIFSFGSVLFELLTGRQPFQGDTAPDILASVLVREPDLNVLPPNLNPRLTELLKRCLEKNPKKRWQAIGDVRAEIETIAVTPHSTIALAQAVAPPQPLWRRAIPFALTAVAVGGPPVSLGFTAGRHPQHRSSPASPSRSATANSSQTRAGSWSPSRPTARRWSMWPIRGCGCGRCRTRTRGPFRARRSPKAC